MVGDSQKDLDVARAAEYSIVCASYGYHHFGHAEDPGAHVLIDSLADLPIILGSLK